MRHLRQPGRLAPWRQAIKLLRGISAGRWDSPGIAVKPAKYSTTSRDEAGWSTWGVSCGPMSLSD